MSKLIKITDDHFTEIREEFEQMLRSGKFADGQIRFNKSIGNIERKAKLKFEHEAWAKMWSLINNFDKEVAWHGIAYRGDEGTDDYVITDILVYPQEVTGATVTTDHAQYVTWLMSHEDDVFNNINMQGHSHVNMGVTPSSTDDTLYEGILQQLNSDMFYIFMIWNKKKDKTIKIYDMKKNVLFETKDVEIEVIRDNSIELTNLADDEMEAVMEFLTEYRDKKMTEDFVVESKNMVKDRIARSSYSYKGYSGGYTGGYSGGYTGGYSTGYSSGHSKATKNDYANDTTRKGKRVDSSRTNSLYGYFDTDDTYDYFE